MDIKKLSLTSHYFSDFCLKLPASVVSVVGVLMDSVDLTGILYLEYMLAYLGRAHHSIKLPNGLASAKVPKHG